MGFHAYLIAHKYVQVTVSRFRLHVEPEKLLTNNEFVFILIREQLVLDNLHFGG
jgi:hypothetical protein